MEKWLIIVFFCAPALPSPLSKQYRADYEYNRGTDAFYKLHVESATPRTARLVCEAEGGSLMVPGALGDIQQVHAMLKRFPDIGRIVIVAPDGQEHESFEDDDIINIENEEIERCEVLTREGEIESTSCRRAAPFVCKVEARDAYYDRLCDVYAKGYVSKISTTGSCYRIPPIAFTWNEAYAECVAEGAHLVVLNTPDEHREVTEILQGSPIVPRAWSEFYFYAGIRADKPKNGTPRVFKTVLNQTLEEAGYAVWSANEPDNYHDSEYCGSLFRTDGLYNDLGCGFEYAFVCEKERQVPGRIVPSGDSPQS